MAFTTHTLEFSKESPALIWCPDSPSWCANKVAATFPTAKPETLVHIKTPDEMFHAVYDKTGIYCDIYQRLPRDPNYGHWPYDTLEYLFTLRRDEYHNEAFYPFFYKVDTEWRLIFNTRYKGMSVYELPNGKEIFQYIKPSEFLGKMVPLEVPEGIAPNRFYFCFSWIWGSHETPAIIDMEAVATKGRCGCCHIEGHYVNYIYSEANAKCLENLYVACVTEKDGRYDFIFELREGKTLPKGESRDESDDES